MVAVRAKHIMTTVEDVVVLEIPSTREKALDIIRQNPHSTYPVVQKDTMKYKGVFRSLMLLEKPNEEQLSLLIEENIEPALPATGIVDLARRLLGARLTMLPVVDDLDNKDIIGVVSISDIIHKVIALQKIDLSIQGYYQRNLTVGWDETPIPLAAKILQYSGQQGLALLDAQGHLRGFVTYTDFIKVAEIESKESLTRTSSLGEDEPSAWNSETIIIIGEKVLTFPERPVKNIMVSNVITVYEKASLTEVAKLNRAHNIDQMPVLDVNNRLVGMIDQWHILQAYLDWIGQKKSGNE